MRKVICFLLMSVIILLSGCVGPTPSEVNIPKEGIWTCDELQAQLSFNRNTTYTPREYSTVVVDGEVLLCGISYNRGSSDVLVCYQGEPREDYKIGDVIYTLVFIDRDDDEMVMKDDHTGELYYFLCIE